MEEHFVLLFSKWSNISEIQSDIFCTFIISMSVSLPTQVDGNEGWPPSCIYTRSAAESCHNCTTLLFCYVQKRVHKFINFCQFCLWPCSLYQLPTRIPYTSPTALYINVSLMYKAFLALSIYLIYCLFMPITSYLPGMGTSSREALICEPVTTLTFGISESIATSTVQILEATMRNTHAVSAIGCKLKSSCSFTCTAHTSPQQLPPIYSMLHLVLRLHLAQHVHVAVHWLTYHNFYKHINSLL